MATEATLAAHHPGVICDLDGVVYRGSKPVPKAVETLNAAVAAGARVVFATNNASRPPAAVDDHLRRLGLRPVGWSVVTSSQAAATYLAERLEPGAAVLAVGGPGVALALAEVGLTPVRASELATACDVRAVMQGAGQQVTWQDLSEVGYLVQSGATWVATNLDATVPTSRGRAPGNGSFVQVVRTTTSATPHVTGKPEAALFDLARSRLGTERDRTIVVGDRLDTDIEGARKAKLPSLFVLGGANSLQDVAFVDQRLRPTYVARDLSGLMEPGLDPLEPARGVAVTPRGCVIVSPSVEPEQLLRSVVAAAWAALDRRASLSADPSLWRDLEGRMGLSRP